MVSITCTHTMNTRAALVYLVGGFLTSACFLRPIGVVRAQGPSSSLDWTVRSWLWNYPVTEDYAMWDTGDPTEEQVFCTSTVVAAPRTPYRVY